ncbi:MAG: PEGA domain-containing protein [Thermofilaceae archaeon]|nr:PEGA domain-containing protein [Thermofilaceae archaeon]
MKLILVLSIPFIFALACAQPYVTTLQPESEVVDATVVGDRLTVLYANGSLIVYSLPYLTLDRMVNLSFMNTKLVGIGALEDKSIVLIFNNGTILTFDPNTGVVRGSVNVEISEPIDRAVVGGRWIALFTKYHYLTEKSLVKLDRVYIYDTKLKAVTFVIDRKAGIRMVYVFNAKIVGNLLLVIGIDTTCEICKLTDTYAAVYNLTNFELLFLKRVGECKADISSRGLIAINVHQGIGFFYDFSTKQETNFNIEGNILNIKIVEENIFILSRKENSFYIFRLDKGTITKLKEYEDGYELFFINSQLYVASSYIYFGDQKLRVASFVPPWKPRLIGEYEGGAILLYGRWLLCSVYDVVERVDFALVQVITEAGSTIVVPRLGLTAQSNNSGVALLKLPPGLYEIRVEKSGFKPNSTEVDVKAGDDLVLHIQLTRDSREVSDENETAFLKILLVNASSQTVSHVAEICDSNGSLLKKVHLNISENVVKLKPGDYIVKVSFNGCSWNRTIQLSSGDNAEVSIHFNCSHDSVVTSIDSDERRRVDVDEIKSAILPLMSLDKTPRNSSKQHLPRLYDIRGEVIDPNEGVKVLVFFYTKCTGCSLLVPKLKGLQVDMVMISPSTYDDEFSLRDYMEEVDAREWYWVLDESASLTRYFNITAFPTVVLLDDGVVKFIGVGYSEEAREMAAIIAGALTRYLEELTDPAALAALFGAFLLILMSRIWKAREWQADFET